MNALRRIWDHFEEMFIAFLLGAMTLVTFVYVALNNLYSMFYWFAEKMPSLEDFWFTIGDAILSVAQAMTWSNALTKALFAWLIFFGIAYGVRTAGHIGVDAIVKLFNHKIQRAIGILACLICLGYAGLLAESSLEWVATLMRAQIGAEDLGHYGVMQWHIALIVPLGFTLCFIRFFEIFVRILRGQQTGLGLADEAAEAAHLAQHDDTEERK